MTMELTAFIRMCDRAAASNKGGAAQEPARRVSRILNVSHGWKVLKYEDGSSSVVNDDHGVRIGQHFAADRGAAALAYLKERIALSRKREDGLRAHGF
jgi:hypothetical protein